MNFKVKETGEIKELHLYDGKNKIDYLGDHFGNANPHGFEYDREEGLWVGSRNDVEWWEDYCRDIQKDEDELQELREKYGEDTVEDAIREAFESYNADDYNDHHGAYQTIIETVKNSR